VFSPLTAVCEERAAAILAEEAPDCAVTLSHRIGRLGLLERENAALLNASLGRLARHTTGAFREALAGSGLEARLYLTQNDGTVLLAEQAERYPVFSFASGPTNSMRGAAFLSGRPDGMVVDVGGTTADVGMLQAGFPREANNVIEVGGVRTLFRMPDLISIGLGGGSLVDVAAGTIGPRSTGYELTRRARVFGGEELTTTDLAVAAGLLDLGDRGRVAHLPAGEVRRMLSVARDMAAAAVDRMKVAAGGVPVLAVGGGAFLIPDDLPGASEVVRVEHGGVANAVGAAIAQVSGECDQVFTGMSRDALLAEAHRIASDRAVAGGADRASLKTVEVEDLPLAYLPGNAVRARVRVVGDIAA
jgi:N-methylhydantoinase A/oxoprolinase/acetone carboxylase beta subunit